MANIRILTTSEARSKTFVATSGQGYTVFADAMTIDGKVCAGPKQFMIKTADLNEFVELVNATKAAWEKAKQVEQETNAKTNLTSA